MKPPRSLSIWLACIITFIAAATMLSTAAASTSEVIGFVLIVGVFMFIGLLTLKFVTSRRTRKSQLAFKLAEALRTTAASKR
jgi:uncharacterized membrane protein